MAGTATRSAKALLAITVVWVGIYWWWQPTRPGMALVSVGAAVDRGADRAPPTTAEVARRVTPSQQPTDESVEILNPPRSPVTTVRVPQSDTPPPREVIPKVETPEVVAFESYRVKDGDTLTRIAQRRYGSIRYADMIYRANRDRLVSPDRLDLDQELRLPTDPGAWERAQTARN